MEATPRFVLAAIDGSAITITAGALIGWLPAATTVLTFIWVLIRIYETKTMKRMLKHLFKRQRQ